MNHPESTRASYKFSAMHWAVGTHDSLLNTSTHMFTSGISIIHASEYAKRGYYMYQQHNQLKVDQLQLILGDNDCFLLPVC